MIEVIQIDNPDITIGIEYVGGRRNSDQNPVTSFFVGPPVSELERQKILEKPNLSPKLSQLFGASAIQAGEERAFAAQGFPTLEHVVLGIELAQHLLEVRGVGRAIVAGYLLDDARTVESRFLVHATE